jgi:V8-like Glu-specific endopeptidase
MEKPTGKRHLSPCSKILVLLAVTTISPLSSIAQTAANEGTAAGIASPAANQDPAAAAAEDAAGAQYWTPERMRDAQPYPMPMMHVNPGVMAPAAGNTPSSPPGAQPGYNPNDPQSKAKMAPMIFDVAADPVAARLAAQSVSEGAIPASASYPSAQSTWEYQGGYRVFPVAPIGKLFFTQNGANYACSGSLIGYKYVVTAGHCVHAGDGSVNSWSTNVMFCPSYDISQGGSNPKVGCWTTNSLTTSTRWYNTAEADADIGLAIYGSSGTLINNYPGSALGWLGYAWNWGIGQHEVMFGYPSRDRAASAHNEFYDFNGGKIYTTAAEEAGYTVNWGTYADSKFIGTAQTPGMSGGPWVMRWGKKYVNNWNNNWVNGVNSSIRCWDQACTDLYMEVSSPQFLRSGTGNGVCSGTCGVVDTIDYTLTNYP